MSARRQRPRSGVCAAAAIALAVLGASFGPWSRALAYEFDSDASCPDGYRYVADRALTFNAANVPAFDEALQFLSAAPAMADRINGIGHVWSTAPYAAGGVGNGINEVGDADLTLWPASAGAIGYTETLEDPATCEIPEADVYIERAQTTWYMPAHYLEPYYDATLTVLSGATSVYFARPAVMHELLHSFGLNHTSTSYSFLNYNYWPWANRDDDNLMVDPLPDDREALRHFYPGTATETDLGVTTTWFDSASISKGAAIAKRLCKPSTGVDYSPSKFDATCGVDASGASGSTEVCPGDTLYVRYALVNYGTTDVTVDEELWFSQNDNLNRTAGADIVSPTQVTAHVASANSSYRWGRKYQVPSGLAWDADYYPILWLDTAGLAERSSQNNWIPLRATVHVKAQTSCP